MDIMSSSNKDGWMDGWTVEKKTIIIIIIIIKAKDELP